MNADLLIGLASLLATVIGSVAAVIGIRQARGPKPIQISGSSDPRPAIRLLKTAGPGSRSKADVLQILARFIFANHEGRATIGALDKFQTSLFLDLFSACTYAPYRKTISKLVAEQMRAASVYEHPTFIAVPKEGNVLLAAEVARRMKLGLLVVRALVPAIRFGDPIEGMIPAGAYVAIVDDIATDGELLVRTVAKLRSHGARVSTCFCAVERMDGNSRDRLTPYGVSLYAPIQLNEGTLRQLAHLPAGKQNEASEGD